MGEWNSNILEAPDDVEILVCMPNWDTPTVAVKDHEIWWVPDTCPDAWTQLLSPPTHWMPLPPPPVAASQLKGDAT
jgi:hypothetical protein